MAAKTILRRNDNGKLHIEALDCILRSSGPKIQCKEANDVFKRNIIRLWVVVY